MQVHVRSRRCSLSRLKDTFPEATILDVTSKGPDPWVRFSPFYPHGDIPVPGESEMFAASVEGVWQGLKVFESADVDPLKFEVTSNNFSTNYEVAL